MEEIIVHNENLHIVSADLANYYKVLPKENSSKGKLSYDNLSKDNFSKDDLFKVNLSIATNCILKQFTLLSYLLHNFFPVL